MNNIYLYNRKRNKQLEALKRQGKTENENEVIDD